MTGTAARVAAVKAAEANWDDWMREAARGDVTWREAAALACRDWSHDLAAYPARRPDTVWQSVP